MKMKFKLLCGALACVMTLAGCKSEPEQTSASSTSAATTTTTTAATTLTNDDGDYEADKDGLVTDDNDEVLGEDSPDVPNTGIATDDNKDKDNDRPATATTSGSATVAIADEAAFAPSYIDMTAFMMTRSQNKVGWGLGKDVDPYNRPVDAVRAQAQYSSLGAEFLTNGKNICLTFDEGYENGYTAAILDTLKEKGVKAVFFVTYDYCKRSPELVRRMIDEGHAVGNHTKTHPSMPDCSAAQMRDEVMFLHNYVKENFGYEMTLFRFPMGEFSEKSLEAVRDMGYTSLFWSFAYLDYNTESQPDPSAALEKIEKSTHSGIYLLHAVSRTNAAILGELIDYWEGQGYTVGAEV